MNGSRRRARRGRLATLVLAAGILLAVGCVTKPDGKVDRAATSGPEASVPDAAERAAIEQVGEMTSEEIAALTAELDDQIKRAEKLHRKALEPMFDALTRACLREPDSIRAVNGAKNLEGSVYRGMSAESLRGYVSGYQRETTREAIEAIAKMIERHNKGIDALAARKPHAIVRSRSNEIVDELNERIGRVNSLLQGGEVDAGVIETRQALFDAVAELERSDRDRSGKAASLAVEFRDSREILGVFVRHAREFSDSLKIGEEAIAIIDEKTAELEALKAADMLPVLAYHKRIALGLPETLPTIASLNALADLVKKSKQESPASWKHPMFRRLYAGWQMNSYEAILRSGLRQRLREVGIKFRPFSGRPSRRSSDFERDAAFRLTDETMRIVNLLTEDEVSSLQHFLKSGMLDPTIYGTRAPAELRDRAKRDLGVFGVILKSDLDTLTEFAGNQKAVSQAMADAQAAEEKRAQVGRYHETLFRTVSEAADLASLAAIKTTLEAERKANPDYWRDTRVLREYADAQARQFYALFQKTLESRALQAARPHMMRGAYSDRWEDACRAFTQTEVEAILGFLQGGIIDQPTFDGRLQHLTAFNQDKLKVTSLKFWQDAAEVVGVTPGE